MKKTIPTLILLSGLISVMLFASCSDERTPPTALEVPSHTETIVLAEMVDASDGAVIEMPFYLRDDVLTIPGENKGYLTITCFLKVEDILAGFADEDLLRFERLAQEIDSLKTLLRDLNVLKVNFELQDSLSQDDEDSLAVVVQMMSADTVEIVFREGSRDTLDTYLDNRYKAAIKLDDDAEWQYPASIYLDYRAIDYLDADTILWGQGFYLSPVPEDTTKEWRGKTLRFDLDKIFVADITYFHDVKPSRPSNILNLPELFPLTTWPERLTSGSHKMYIRFGAENTLTAVTATLYIIYEETG